MNSKNDSPSGKGGTSKNPVSTSSEQKTAEPNGIQGKDSESRRATETAKKGEPLTANSNRERSPKQENL